VTSIRSTFDELFQKDFQDFSINRTRSGDHHALISADGSRRAVFFRHHDPGDHRSQCSGMRPRRRSRRLRRAQRRGRRPQTRRGLQDRMGQRRQGSPLHLSLDTLRAGLRAERTTVRGQNRLKLNEFCGVRPDLIRAERKFRIPVIFR
jgi:hypothetical protein